MKQSLTQRIQEMKNVAAELEKGATWESRCGYTVDLVNDPFFSLNDYEVIYEEELKLA